MKSTFLYFATVLIWGTTWFAIEFQLGEVAVEISLFYRFALAALVMWGYCLVRKLNTRLSLANHLAIFAFALFNFSFNYILMYWAQAYLTSAMASIAFSTLLLMNIFNYRIFFGQKLSLTIILGAICGVSGILALFWQDISSTDLQSNALRGLMLVLGGTLLASFGNMINVRNTQRKVNIIIGNAWGMLYGAGALLLFALMQGSSFVFPSTPSYWISLTYLSIFGTVIAFACYFILFSRIGADKASYVIVLFPFVAVLMSSLFEEFPWYPSTILGFGLVIIGNLIILLKKNKVVATD